MMPKPFKAERQSLCVNFAIEINNLCNNCGKVCKRTEQYWGNELCRLLFRIGTPIEAEGRVYFEI